MENVVNSQGQSFGHNLVKNIDEGDQPLVGNYIWYGSSSNETSFYPQGQIFSQNLVRNTKKGDQPLANNQH
jgi:hypothetical protein